MKLENIKGDLTGGIMAGIIGIPICMGYSVLAFAPLGEKYLPVGIVSFMVSMIVMNIVLTFFGGVKILLGGPNAMVAVMLSSALTAGLALTKGMADQIPLALTLFFIVSCISGLIQLVSGFLKIGGLAKYIPLPVVAGLMNGTALIIMLKQLRPLLGLGSTAPLTDFDFLTKNVQLLTLAVGVITFIATLKGPALLKKVPPAVIGIFTGTAAYYAIKYGINGVEIGPVIGKIPTGIPMPEYALKFVKLFADGDLVGKIPSLLPLAASLAVVTTLLTLVAVVTADNLTHGRSDSNKELIGQGIGNTVCALFGGTCNVGSVTATVTSQSNGASTAASKLICGLFMLGVLLALGVVISLVPKVVLAGVLCFMALKLIEPWSISLAKDILTRKATIKDSVVDVAIINIVVLILVFIGIIQAVFAGVIISLIYFVYRMTTDNIRREYGADKVHSNTLRNEQEFNVLEHNGNEVRVLELEGALFFGTTDKLSVYLEELLEKDVKFIILDFSRVSEIDSTGFNILIQVSKKMRERNVLLLISAIRSKSKISAMVDYTSICKIMGEDKFFDSIDDALSWAEDRLLDKHLGADRYGKTLAFKDFGMLRGMTEEERNKLEEYVEHHSYRDGEAVFTQDDSADRMHFLARGRAHIIIRSAGGASWRVGTICLGAIFGEMAIIDGKPRSATVKADGDIECFELTLEKIERMKRNHPEIAFKFFSGLSHELSKRIRINNRIITELKA